MKGDDFFAFTDIYSSSCDSRVCRETKCSHLYILPYVVVKKGSLCNRNSMFFVGINCHESIFARDMCACISSAL